MLPVCKGANRGDAANAQDMRKGKEAGLALLGPKDELLDAL